jgi:hypothetical protein
LGKGLIKAGFNLVSGFGRGIGASVIAGAIEECNKQHKGMDRLKLRPFPRSLDPTKKKKVYDAVRKDLLGTSGVAIFIAGNKLDDAGKKEVPSEGMEEELQIARQAGHVVIPVGATGFLAQKYWRLLEHDLRISYHGVNVKKEFATIGSEKKSNEEIVEAVVQIIRKVRDG